MYSVLRFSLSFREIFVILYLGCQKQYFSPRQHPDLLRDSCGLACHIHEINMELTSREIVAE